MIYALHLNQIIWIISTQNIINLCTKIHYIFIWCTSSFDINIVIYIHNLSYLVSMVVCTWDLSIVHDVHIHQCVPSGLVQPKVLYQGISFFYQKPKNKKKTSCYIRVTNFTSTHPCDLHLDKHITLQKFHYCTWDWSIHQKKKEEKTTNKLKTTQFRCMVLYH